MRTNALLGFCLMGLLAAGCGGGDPELAGTPIVGAAAVAEERAARQAAAATAAAAAAAQQQAAARPSSQCGVPVASGRLAGLVTAVSDGDTLTLDDEVNGTVKVRLDTIDAPETDQSYGSTSRGVLAAQVLNQHVTVAYAKKDFYGRYVGAVFTPACEYVNLKMVATGMAWFYKAYQCEVSADVRSMFAAAQNSAVAAGLGLWADPDPEAPWFHRNGKEPATPTCTGQGAAWSADLALSTQGATVATTPGQATPIEGATSSAGIVCYVGSRGGTYTLTATGGKNYGRC